MSARGEFTSGKATRSGRALYYETWGSGFPAVLIEVGSTMAGTKDPGWEPIINALLASHCVVLYDRAGLGLSDPAASPRPISEFSADLHAVLSTARISGPVILVGCSFGGMICAHFGAAYPEMAGGILLLDPPHPEINQRVLAMLPSETEQTSPSLRNFRRIHYQELYEPTAIGELEQLDLRVTMQQMRESPSLGDIPLVVLTAGIDEWEDDFPQDIARKYSEIWLDAQKEYASMSTRSEHQIIIDSDHLIHVRNPHLVVQNIFELARNLIP